MHKNLILVLILICFAITGMEGQVTYPSFGKGLQVTAPDSTFYLKLGFRFQSLYTSEWNLGDDDFANREDLETAFFIRRSRIKLNGWALTPKLTYKAELALSNRDNGGGNSSNFSNAANIILDAQIEYQFAKGLSVWLGQGKLPGNRERIISSGNLQFVDRSRLNSRFTTDRDVGIMLKHKHKIGKTFEMTEVIARTSGEGKNVTSGNVGGSSTSFKVEFFPFGGFQSKGAYIGGSEKFEDKPKLAVAFAYDTNVDAGRERGRLGAFIENPNGDFVGKTLNSTFIDMMFKYQGLSIMAEYANVETDDNDPNLTVNGNVIATYYTGNATNWAIGYMFPSKWEIAARYTDVNPDTGVDDDETQLTFGLSKYIVGHKLKIQSDITRRNIENSDDDLFFRLQLDFHF